MRSSAVLIALFVLVGCGKKEADRPMSAEQVAQEMAAVKMEPGQWEATNEIVSVDAPGRPPQALRQMVGQKTALSSCVTPEQAAKPSASFLAAQKNSDCSYQDFSMESGVMRGTISCTGGQMPGKMTMKMEGRYGPRSYDMNMDMTVDLGGAGKTMNIKAHTVGRRVGDCA